MSKNKISSNLAKYKTKNPLKKILIQNFSEKIIKIIKNLPEIKIILDAGCGEGFIMQKISKELPHLNIEGLDFNIKSLEIAKKLLPRHKFFKQNITNISLTNSSYDLILALEILEHLEQPEKALRELQKTTNNYCLISVPWEPFFSLGNLLSGKNIKRLGNDEGHLQRWNKKQITNLISQYFDIISVDTSFPWTIILAKK